MKIKLELTEEQITTLANALVLATLETHTYNDAREYGALEKEIISQAINYKNAHEMESVID